MTKSPLQSIAGCKVVASMAIPENTIFVQLDGQLVRIQLANTETKT